MTPEHKKNLLRWLGYPAFVFFTFLLFFYWSFPYERLIQRFTVPLQQRSQIRIKMRSLEPSMLTGVRIEGLDIAKPVSKGTAQVLIPELWARVSLLPLLGKRIKATFGARVARGRVEGMIDQSKKRLKVRLKIRSLELAALAPPPGAARNRRKNDPPRPLLEVLFAPVYGRVRSDINLLIDNSKPSNQRRSTPAKGKKRSRQRRSRRRSKRRSRRRRAYKPRGLDPRKLTGTANIRIRKLSIGPGYFPSKQMGELPVPLIRLGTLNLRLKAGKSAIRILQGGSSGPDGELRISGYVQIRSRFMYSVFRGKIKFRIDKAFLNRKSTPELLKTALGMLGPPKSDGFYHYRVRFPFRGRPYFKRL